MRKGYKRFKVEFTAESPENFTQDDIIKDVKTTSPMFQLISNLKAVKITEMDERRK